MPAYETWFKLPQTNKYRERSVWDFFHDAHSFQQLHILGPGARQWVLQGLGWGGLIPDSGAWHCLYGAGVPQRPCQNDTCLCFPQKAFYTLAKIENMKIKSE